MSPSTTSASKPGQTVSKPVNARISVLELQAMSGDPSKSTFGSRTSAGCPKAGTEYSRISTSPQDRSAKPNNSPEGFATNWVILLRYQRFIALNSEART